MGLCRTGTELAVGLFKIGKDFFLPAKDFHHLQADDIFLYNSVELTQFSLLTDKKLLATPGNGVREKQEKRNRYQGGQGHKRA
ncbi:hypothetical protein SDC9_70469 [bioreactor metagenome]|uniref:Uncharacterized protein n=1 Tax=bioreactor metagenome TaxID=1076179 RepID=A0A644Y603_9ZZZZ